METFFIPQTENNFLKLERPIVFFDLETTGKVPLTDRIVEIYAVKLNIDGVQEELHHLINPTIPISAGAIEAHGITDEMVADKPTFKDLGEEIAAFFQGCDLGGYNIKKYDVRMLMEEFHRCKKYPINYNEVKLVDAMGIYHSKEKRDLSAALRFYCQKEHADAHSAKSDVLATIDILKRQLLMYEDLEPNTSFLHDFLNAGDNVDFAGKFIRDEEGRIILNFGMHKGKEACSEPDYLKWMYEKGEFAVDTKMVAKKIYMNCKWEGEINSWLQVNKIHVNLSTLSALYTTLKFGNNIFPFSVDGNEGKVTINYLIEPPVQLRLVHPDAVKLMLSILDRQLRDKGHINDGD